MPELTNDEAREAIRAGRVVYLASPNAAKIFRKIDAKGKPTYPWTLAPEMPRLPGPIYVRKPTRKAT